MWALRHPDGDRTTAEAGKDISLREAALRSLLAIEGVQSLRSWLAELHRDAPFNLRDIAQRAMEDDGSATDASAHDRRTPDEE